MPDDDVHADRYAIAEEMLAAAGFDWYEVSNWAAAVDARSRHNLLYWTGGDWWGIGPGAHSHVGGVRWWNVKHPREYAARLTAEESPAAARELLTGADREVERIMLGLRLHDGLALDGLSERALAVAQRATAEGLLESEHYYQGLMRLTLRGRLLADALVRDLVE
jgi:oxygen-independent coproporphyrinogen-3 oxidase